LFDDLPKGVDGQMAVVDDIGKEVP
jgi:hypothetical protein